MGGNRQCGIAGTVEGMKTEQNLPEHANPCCGYVTDASSDLEKLEEMEVAAAGDYVICINCGALMVYTDPRRNRMRYASRIEVERIPRELRQKVGRVQRHIQRRGWVSREARRRDGN